MPITAAREEFLSDIITTAIEGGIGYWSVCSQYQWVDEMEPGRPLRVSVGQRLPDEGTRATVEDTQDDNREYHITPSVIHNGIRAIAVGKVRINDGIRRNVLLADADSDAGMLDATDADCIVQAGLFGEVRYG